MTREPDRFEEKARETFRSLSRSVWNEEDLILAIAVALRAVESSALERAAQIAHRSQVDCFCKERPDDFPCAACMEAARIEGAIRGTRDRALASPAAAPRCCDLADKGHRAGCPGKPAAAPAAETEQKWGGPYLWPEREPAAPAPTEQRYRLTAAWKDGALSRIESTKEGIDTFLARCPEKPVTSVIEPIAAPAQRAEARIAELETALVKIRDGCGYGLGNDIPWVRAVAKSALAARAAPHAKGEGT